MHGILLVDKAAGMTSHDVVDCIRRASGLRRIGHTGTLDPAATGLMVLCLGAATRLSEHLTLLDKVYEGAMRFGIETDSYDLDGKVVAERPVPALTLDAVQAVCDRFTGAIQQVPPMVSAVKVGGERLYKRARKGQVVERQPRSVLVREFRVLHYESPDAFVRVCCTRGTYVRSLCHEVGQELGCGAVLASLRRTFVGDYSVEQALPVSEFKTPADVEKRLTPLDSALLLPSVAIRDTSHRAVASGGVLTAQDLTEPCPVTAGWVQIKTTKGRLLALGQVELEPSGVRIHAKRVFTE
jgi:tRNA pseudouridine55 synthase